MVCVTSMIGDAAACLGNVRASWGHSGHDDALVIDAVLERRGFVHVVLYGVYLLRTSFLVSSRLFP